MKTVVKGRLLNEVLYNKFFLAVSNIQVMLPACISNVALLRKNKKTYLLLIPRINNKGCGFLHSM